MKYVQKVFVFNDMLGMKEAELVGVAPAYEGDSMDGVKKHELFNDKVACCGSFYM